MIRIATIADAEAISRIYNYYIKNTVITFEEEEVSAKEIEKRISKVLEKYPWYVYILNDTLVGYAYASEWKPRRSYQFSVETTVYLHPDFGARGIGTLLYEKLISDLRAMDLHVAIGGITLPNDSSVALHEKFGFKKTGQFKEVGYKFNQWLDVGYWQLIF
jgi:phosphinothricin acetyltransferase